MERRKGKKKEKKKQVTIASLELLCQNILDHEEHLADKNPMTPWKTIIKG
jgi:hypothetical protein